jgi:hypothetical protein
MPDKRQSTSRITNLCRRPQALIAEFSGYNPGWKDGDGVSTFLGRAQRAKATGDSKFFAENHLPQRYMVTDVAKVVQARIAAVLENAL